MTPRQCYSELAKVLGKQVGPESSRTSFIRAQRINQDNLKIIQNKLLVLLEKIDYDRAHRDFGNAFRSLRARRPANPLPPEESTIRIPPYASPGPDQMESLTPNMNYILRQGMEDLLPRGIRVERHFIDDIDDNQNP